MMIDEIAEPKGLTEDQWEMIRAWMHRNRGEIESDCKTWDDVVRLFKQQKKDDGDHANRLLWGYTPRSYNFQVMASALRIELAPHAD